MLEQFSRSELIFGKESTKILNDSYVAVFGLGGVGGYVLEALARSGVGKFDIVDNDKVSVTNLNRQLLATHETIGQYKTDVAEKRVLSINPDAKITKYNTFFTSDTADEFDFSKYDYVVDAIDTVVGKLELVVQSKTNGVPIICSMGAGNKVDPTRFEVADISKTSVCPLAKVMRQELKKRGINDVKVVYSKEPPIKQDAVDIVKDDAINQKKQPPGSNAFVPSVAGLIIAGEVIKDLIKYNIE